MALLNLNSRFPVAQYADAPVPDGLLHIYYAGTERLVPAFEDPNLTFMRANPIAADEAGVLPACYLVAGDYRLVVTTKRGKVVHELDNVSVSDDAAGPAPTFFPDRAAMLADDKLTYAPNVPGCSVAPGQFVHVANIGARFRVAPEGAGDTHMQSAGGIGLYVEPDDAGRYSIAAWGGEPDSGEDCKPALDAALNVLGEGDTLFFPKGTYLKNGVGSGQECLVPVGVDLLAAEGARLVTEGYPVLCAMGRNTIEGFHIDSTVSGNLVGIEVHGEDVVIRGNTFEGGNERVRIYNADRCSVDDNTFLQTGYGVIQRVGFTSNAGRVSRNRFVECTGDCVELNSEAANPCFGWQITDNYAKDIGGTSVTSVTTEDRFLGATATRGIVVTGNLIDGVSGDSAFHFEGSSGDCIISNNIIKNPHGSSGALLYFTSSLQETCFQFSQNLVVLDSSYAPLSGDSKLMVYMLGGDDAQLVMSGNVLLNESSHTDIDFLESSYDKNYNLIFRDNHCYGWRRVVSARNAADRGCIVDGNLFKQITEAAVYLQGTSERVTAITNNSFVGCGEVWDTDTASSVPVRVSGNVLFTTNLKLAGCLGLSVGSNRFGENNFGSGATTDIADGQSYTGGAGQVAVFDVSEGPVGADYALQTLHLRFTDGSSGSANTSTYLVNVARTSSTEYAFSVADTLDSGSGAPVTLSMVGSKLVFESASDRWVSTRLPGVVPNHTASLAAP